MTLGDTLKKLCRTSDKGVTFIESSDREEFLSYKEIYDQALKVLAYLQQQGINPRNELVMQVDDNKAFIVVFWACILGGIIPVPITVGRNDDHRQKLINVWKILNNPFLIISQANLQKLKKHIEIDVGVTLFSEEKVISVEQIYDVTNNGTIHPANEQEIAYIQFSSGSTGNPKGVVLTHRNLITNMKAISEGSQYTAIDSKLSWMPLTHDMGLIGFHLCPLFCGMNHFLMPTNLFIRRPTLWLDIATQHKTSILCSPNFGYKYLLKHYNPSNNYHWNLSHVRMIYNGAEPISEEICTDFVNALEIYGLKKQTMYPVYGLAEASLAVSFSNLEDEVESVYVDREKTKIANKVIVEEKGSKSASFVNVGKSVPYCSIQLTDEKNNECEEDVIGHIKIKGENVTSGYYNNRAATNDVLSDDGWLDTGDLGFIHDGNLYVTGRNKDIIFVNGQNYYPHDIEKTLEEINQIELGKVVVAGHTCIATGEEEIIVFILYKGKLEKFIPIHNEVMRHVNNDFGFEPDLVIPVKEIPKTTSGKVQRFRLLEKFSDGIFYKIIEELADLCKQNDATTKVVNFNTETEKKLAEIWKEILPNVIISQEQSFFEIGGNSLKAAQIISIIHNVFSIELDYNLIFERPTIREIAAEIDRREVVHYQSIPVVNTREHYPLTSSQKRLYYLWEVDKESLAYNIPSAFLLEGNLDIKKLNNAIGKIINRHDILRASFHMFKSEPIQKFSDQVDFFLTMEEVDFADAKKHLRRKVKPFNFNKAPLFRIELLNVSDSSYILFLDFHHIIFDGVSYGLFLNELFEFYQDKKLPEPEIKYKDYCLWENENADSERIKKQGNYWLKQFQEEIPVLNLPTDFVRPSLMSHQGEKLEFNLDEDITSKLKNLAKHEGTSLFILLLSAYQILLSKYSGQEDIVTGIPVAGRCHRQLHSLIGMFVNNLAVRTYPKGDINFNEFLKQVNSTFLNSLDNQEYPFKKLVDQLDQKRDVSRNALFDTMFIYQNMELPEQDQENFFIKPYFFDPGFSKYDISFEFYEIGNEVKFLIEYSFALFQRSTIQKLAIHFENLLNSIVKMPQASLSDLTVLDKQEQKDLVFDFNQTKTTYPKDKVIHQLIEEQARKNPSTIAIARSNRCEIVGKNNHETNRQTTSGISQLTYAELDAKSSQLANLLRKKGAAPNIPVGIVLERTPEFILAVLAVLKSGSCFLPIDKDLPPERIKYIIIDSQTQLLFSDKEWLNSSGIAKQLSNIKCFDVIDEEVYSTESNSIENINSSSNLAYIIYTSGTTGNPKGVMIEHGSLVNYATFAEKSYIQGEKLSFPLYSSISFDLTITSIFTPLISGNKIITYHENSQALSIEDVISDNQVHLLKATPSHLKILKENRELKNPEYKSKIRRFIVGGESFSTKDAKDILDIFDEKIEIYNEYGPTEATVGCMIYKYNPQKNQSQSVPIGVPTSNTKIFLLDKSLKPVPQGVHGEIYISGDCLARGYLFNPQLTEEKFIDNPFLPGQKMYKTGDIARRLTDGNLDFIGRLDQQLKINGYRIELEEIEQRILKHEYARETVVIMRNKSLIAYITLSPGFESADIKISDIKKYLGLHLPAYMIPKYIIEINELPLTQNGKVNINLLPAPTGNDAEKKQAESDTEKIMVSVWEDVLNEPEIGITDNFFEFGGDSIKAVQIASRLFEKKIAVNVKDILTYQTIEQLCHFAEAMDGSIQYEQGIIEGEVELNPIQRWFFEQNFKNPHFYNQSVLLEFNKPINKEILQKTFKLLIEHHDALRMNYNSEKEIMFYNNGYLDSEFIVEEYDLEAQDEIIALQGGEIKDRKQLARKLNSNSLSPESRFLEICYKIKEQFNIENNLLVKAAIIKNDISDLLLITAHHLIIDGISWRIVLEDFYNIYTSLKKDEEIKLPKKTASLIVWNEKLVEFSNSEEIKNQLKYWKQKVDDQNLLSSGFSLAVPQLNEIHKASFRLKEEETKFLLTNANKPYNTNVEILLVTALVRALKEWRNVDDIVIEMESHGRCFEDVDVKRTIGWFTSMFPLKFACHNDNLDYQIKHVKEEIRNIPNVGSGYGVLRYLNKSLNINSTSTDVRFNHLGQFGNEINNDLFRYERVNIGSEIDLENHHTASLEVNSMIINNELLIEINSVKESDNSIVRIYQNHLNSILTHIKDEEDVHFTPSDFSLVDLDNNDFKALFE